MGFLLDIAKRFRDDARGAVTTDYVFLTAMMMGTGISVTSGVVNGTTNGSVELGNRIELIGRAALNNDYSTIGAYIAAGARFTTEPETGTPSLPDAEPVDEPEQPVVVPDSDPYGFQPLPSTLNDKQTNNWTNRIESRTDTQLRNVVRNQLERAENGDRTEFRVSVAGMGILEMQKRGLNFDTEERWYNDFR